MNTETFNAVCTAVRATLDALDLPKVGMWLDKDEILIESSPRGCIRFGIDKDFWKAWWYHSLEDANAANCQDEHVTSVPAHVKTVTMMSAGLIEAAVWYFADDAFGHYEVELKVTIKVGVEARDRSHAIALASSYSLEDIAAEAVTQRHITVVDVEVPQ